jgi:hypothetical protein
MVTVMIQSRLISANERVLEPMLALAGCSKTDRIIVAGAKGIELAFALHRRGYVGAAATADCGHPARQYGAALVDWRQRTLKALETTLDWLVAYLRPLGVVVIWVDAQNPTGQHNLRAALERRGFRIETGRVHEHGFVISARRTETRPILKAA